VSKGESTTNKTAMESMKELFQKKIIPGVYAMLFVTALLLLSILLVRRNIYF
jgi:hypothetical protein